ncbi:MAG: TolC family outer membrane protein [Arcobacteraceae bacterium]|jgi:adhesin transport system outer membrane protein|nr:TolC family outer membrane protein [Arcobacteraceae bacterium]
MLQTKQRLVSIVVAGSIGLFACNADAFTLKQSVSEVLGTNPIIQERLKNFYETQQDLNIAKSEYLPSIDFNSSYGHNKAGRIDDDVTDMNYKHYTNSLKITQNLFNGFSTTNKVDYQKARILAAAYHYIENANDISFQTVGAYIDVIRSYKLLQNAKDSVQINEKIYQDVQELYTSGLTTKSEMTKIFAALSLAKSNLIVQQNNAKDKEFRFKRLLGRDVDVSHLILPSFDLAMPESLQRATMYAIENNPSIIVSNYNIQGAQALYRERKSSFYPIINLELEQLYNDAYDQRNNGYESADDRQRAYVTLNWNLYRGGADKAALQKTRSNIHKEVEIQRDLKRQTIEGLELSWSAYEMIALQLKQLYEYSKHSEETLESYKSEYEMGRRTLLDLLAAQNDLVNSRSQIINAEFDRLFAQYRILDAMGILVSTIAGDTPEYTTLISPTKKPFDIIEDVLPVSMDSDNDKITDSLDICQSSVNNNDIMPYGCSQKLQDSDFDGVTDTLDRCRETRFGAKVDEYGCEIEGSENKFEVNADTYVLTPDKYTALSHAKDTKLGLYDYEYSPKADNHTPSTDKDKHLMYDNFEEIKRYEAINVENFSTTLDNRQKEFIKDIASDIKLRNRDDLTVTVIGHTKTINDDELSFKTSYSYALAVKNELIANGVKENFIVTESRMFKDINVLETRDKDMSLNERVMVTLYVPKIAEATNVLDTAEPIQEQSETIKVIDDDNDGVVNDVDLCPNTPNGYQVDDKGCSIKLNLQVLFENDSALVMLHSLERVDRFRQFLQDHPNYKTVITGHTSKTSVSNVKYNMDLSLKRAEAIKRILVAGGIDASRIQTIGKGFNEPVTTNDTYDGQAQNRRIEAELINGDVTGGPNKAVINKDASGNWNF